MKLINARVYTEDFAFEKRDFCFSGERIAASDDGGEVWDADGLTVIPGLIDLHFHGCDGVDFCDGTEASLQRIACYEAAHGITGICPACMPAPKQELLRAFRAAAAYRGDGAVLCGINMEGPYMSREKLGGNDGDHLVAPSLSDFADYADAGGDLLKIVDVAPEIDGGMDLIRALRGKYRISLAHTAVGYTDAMRAFDAGASQVTHLFNAMSAFHHRDTGLAGAAMDAGADVELIGDGLHISDPMIRAAFRMFGAEKIILISDSILATGLSDGDYRMGNLPIRVRSGLAYLEDGTIAGACSDLYDNLCHTVGCGIRLEDALRTATYNPAKALGVLDQMGTLSVGKLANFALIDGQMRLMACYVRGRRYL